MLALSEKRFLWFLRVYNVFENPKFRGGFRSVNELARFVDGGVINPNPHVRMFLSECLAEGFLRYEGGRLVLDKDRFEVFVEECEFGRIIIEYVNNISTIRI